MGSTPKSLSCCGAPLQEFKLFFYVYFFTRLTTGSLTARDILASSRVSESFLASMVHTMHLTKSRGVLAMPTPGLDFFIPL